MWFLCNEYLYNKIVSALSNINLHDKFDIGKYIVSAIQFQNLHYKSLIHFYILFLWLFHVWKITATKCDKLCVAMVLIIATAY